MPVHTNSIGDFEFLQIEGAPHLRQEQLEIIERAGVDGSGLRKLGRRGRPFELQTTNYEESFETAQSKMQEYKALVGDDPVDLVRMSLEEGTFLVLEVRERALFAIFNAIGGIQDDPGEPVNHEACHIVSWTLLG
jgi:hypothetical protein